MKDHLLDFTPHQVMALAGLAKAGDKEVKDARKHLIPGTSKQGTLLVQLDYDVKVGQPGKQAVPVDAWCVVAALVNHLAALVDASNISLSPEDVSDFVDNFLREAAANAYLYHDTAEPYRSQYTEARRVSKEAGAPNWLYERETQPRVTAHTTVTELGKYMATADNS